MRARTRDAIAIVILLLGAVTAWLAWDVLGPWVSLGLAFGSAIAVIAVYRARPRRTLQDVPTAEVPTQPARLKQD